MENLILDSEKTVIDTEIMIFLGFYLLFSFFHSFILSFYHFSIFLIVSINLPLYPPLHLSLFTFL